MTAKNDVTGDTLKTRPNSKNYRDNYDRIFHQRPKRCGKCKTCKCSTKG